MSDPLEDMAGHQDRAETPPPPPTDAQVRASQMGRARVMALLLGAFVVLMFAITIVKMRNGH